MSAKSQKKKTNQNSKSKRPWFPIVLLIVAVFLYYGNTINNGFSLDDDLVTTTDNSVHDRVERGISGIPEIFKTHYVDNQKQKYEYRPIVTSSFALQHQFFGSKTLEKQASISHLISVMLYALLVILIYLLIFKLFPEKGWLFPFLVAALFLIHPIHSEVVNNIKCRDELFAMIFGLLALFSFLKYADSDYKKVWYVVLGVLAIVASILSKKVGVTFVVLVPLSLFYFRDIKLKKILLFVGFIFVGVFIVSLLKKGGIENGVMRENMYFENPLYFSESIMDRIPMFFYSIMFYVKMLLVPAPLVYYYGYDQIEIVGWENPFVWLGMVTVLSGVFFAIKRLKKKEMWAFGFLFFMFGVGGGANLIFPVVGIVAERFVFVGSLGLIFMAVYYGYSVYENNKKKLTKRVFHGLGIVIVVLSFLQIVARNQDWDSRFSLYKNDIKNLSNSAKAHSLLGTEYIGVADSVVKLPNTPYGVYISYVDSAIVEFETCVKIFDGYYNSANNAGALYFGRKKDHYKAKPYFLKALEYKPDYVEALFNYGNCLENDLKGIEELQRILEPIKTDSIDKLKLESSETYEKEIRAAFAASGIKLELNLVLSRLNFNNGNWNNYALNQISTNLNTYLNIENGILKKGYNEPDYIGFTTNQLNKAVNGDVKVNLQQLVAASDNYFKEIINQNLEESSLTNPLYKESLKYNLEKIKVNVQDSAVACWTLALDANKSYYLAYKSLMNLHLRNKNYDELIIVCEKAISEGKFDDNTEFYVTIGNIYNNQMEYSKAIIYMDKTLQELDRVYAKLYANERLELNKKQSVLRDIINRKKQVYGFISKIYYDSGNQVKAVEYKKLSEQVL